MFLPPLKGNQGQQPLPALANNSKEVVLRLVLEIFLWPLAFGEGNFNPDAKFIKTVCAYLYMELCVLEEVFVFVCRCCLRVNSENVLVSFGSRYYCNPFCPSVLLCP